MTRINQHLTAVLLASAAVLLSACSSEPSSGDIKALIDREIKPELEFQAQLMGNLAGMVGNGAAKEAKAELKDVRKVGCKSSGESAYTCDVELVMQQGEKSRSTVVPMRFVKGSNGWALTRR